MTRRLDDRRRTTSTLGQRRRSRGIPYAAPLIGLFWCVSPAFGVGEITQLPGTSGCTSDNGSSGACVDGNQLSDAWGVAISPDGKNVYVASPGSDSVTIFDRDPGTGALVQKPGAAGCINDNGSGGCTDGNGLQDAVGIAGSPDGKNVYVASSYSDALTIFDRDLGSGTLVQKAGAAGCISESGNGGCLKGNALADAQGVTVSPDGKNVYVASSYSDSLTIFDRDPGSGALTQKAGTAGCISEHGGANCIDGNGLADAYGVTVSPDGKNVYVASAHSDSITIFDRNPDSGALVQKAGTAGCISDNGGPGCIDGNALGDAFGVAVSPDGKQVYVAAAASDAVAVFDRDLSSGALAQKAGVGGCVSHSGSGGTCVHFPQLADAWAVAVSPDGHNVYVAASASNALVVFDRNPLSGVLAIKPGTSACVSDNGNGGACVDGVALAGPRGVAVSPDGNSVYGATVSSDSVTAFSRQPCQAPDPCAGVGGAGVEVIPASTFVPAGSATSGVRVVTVNSGSEITQMTQAESVFAAAALPGNGRGLYARIHHGDPLGHFSGKVAYPSGTNGDRFVYQGTGVLQIVTPGNYVVGVNSDDGFRLRIGADLSYVSEFFGPTSASDTNVVVHFSTAGLYPFRLTHFDNTANQFVEMYAKPGNHTALDGNERLIGDTANGGLAVYANLGLYVRSVKGPPGIGSLASAEALLAGNGASSQGAGYYSTINFLGSGADGNYPSGNAAFPNYAAGSNDFATESTALVFLPEATTYTFGINEDDGAKLLINGSEVIFDDGNHAAHDVFGTFTAPAAGLYPLRLVHFQQGGASTLELFAAKGTHTTFNASLFRLVGDVANGGLQVFPANLNGCGDGVVVAGEQCDLGPLNGAASACCSAACQFRGSVTCRDAVDLCDAAEVCSGTSGVCPMAANGSNLAAGAPATQSSTAFSSPANLANDGNSDGELDHGSVTHTGFDHEAWWQVDLGSVQQLGTIEVWPRTDCCGDRSSDFYVLVSDVPFAQSNLLATIGQGGVGAFFQRGPSGTPTSITVNRSGRYVRVQLIGTNYLSLAEVKVFQGIDGKQAAGHPCRTSSGDCDPAETCNGTSNTCPGDAISPLGTACPPDDNPCTLDICNGSSVTCQHPAGNAGMTCRVAVDVCDIPEVCTGTDLGCPPDGLFAGGTECRESAGDCDAPEECDGIHAICPPDGKVAAGNGCADDDNPCTVDHCDGSRDDCQHAPGNAGEPCRPKAGGCDIAEVCDGTTVCPPDVIATAGSECRPVAGVCDITEVCSGDSPQCPTDAFQGSGTVCRESSDECDTAESCTGHAAACPADTGKPDGDGDGLCDEIDPCSNIGFVSAVRPKLMVKGVLTPPGDDRLSLKGLMTLPYPLAPDFAPIDRGVRLILSDANHAVGLDVTLPEGAYDKASKAGWKSNGAGKWIYLNRAGVQGITKITLKDLSARTPGLVQFAFTGKNGSFPITAVPVRATVIFDTPNASSGACGEVTFPGPAPAPSCSFIGAGNGVRCR